jgi:NDP-hexose 3,5-(Or5-) epimerase
MEINQKTVLDAFHIQPVQYSDVRGCFFESFRRDELERATGHVFTPVQTNFSVSHRNVLRAMHGVTTPPGQAKLVTCVRGRVLDVTLDTRVGSPTFGLFDTNVLDEESGAAVFIAEGLAHGFLSLTDNACVNYVCSTLYVPGTPYEIHPFDPDVAIPWNAPEDCIVAEKDLQAPTLAEAAARGILPTYAACQARYEELRATASCGTG